MKSKVTHRKEILKLGVEISEIEDRKTVKKNKPIWLWKRRHIYVCVTESLCYTPATNTTLLTTFQFKEK